jgi:hypothetical protein
MTLFTATRNNFEKQENQIRDKGRRAQLRKAQ